MVISYLCVVGCFALPGLLASWFPFLNSCLLLMQRYPAPFETGWISKRSLYPTTLLFYWKRNRGFSHGQLGYNKLRRHETGVHPLDIQHHFVLSPWFLKICLDNSPCRTVFSSVFTNLRSPIPSVWPRLEVVCLARPTVLFGPHRAFCSIPIYLGFSWLTIHGLCHQVRFSSPRNHLIMCKAASILQSPQLPLPRFTDA